MIHKTIETERLVLRPMTGEDAEAAFRWCGDPKVNRYMIYSLYTRAEDVRAWIETLDNESETSYEYGFVLKETGELIGAGGIHYVPETESWEIGYNIRRDMWNKGLTTEAMRAMIDAVSAWHRISALTAAHAADNPASGRVMEKLGLRFDHDGEYSKTDGSETFRAKYYRLDIKE